MDALSILQVRYIFVSVFLFGPPFRGGQGRGKGKGPGGGPGLERLLEEVDVGRRGLTFRLLCWAHQLRLGV